MVLWRKTLRRTGGKLLSPLGGGERGLVSFPPSCPNWAAKWPHCSVRAAGGEGCVADKVKALVPSEGRGFLHRQAYSEVRRLPRGVWRRFLAARLEVASPWRCSPL